MSSNWFGQNWQQDQGPMDHDVSHPSNFMGIVPVGNNTAGGDDISYSYKLLGQNLTLDHCEKLYINETRRLLKTHPDGFCNTSFDKILCWPPTPYNSVARIKCFSEFLGITYDDTQNATRECSYNGTWHKSTYDDCTELEMYPTSVETQTNIYLIGYIISSVTLAVAIFIFTYFKELRCLRNKIHMNLMWSYLLTYCMWIIILIELNFREHMAVTCVFVVTLLHYFHITTFFWMFVEGLYLYILVVRTLTRESFKLRVYALIGWGTPLFFIILWAVIKSILLEPAADSSDACNWFGVSDIDYIFQAPTILVLAINIIFMISIMVVLVTKLRSANTLEIQQYRKAVKALAVLIPLLGVTYAITIYAPSLTIWDMLRSALLSVQGFMVALFYCFLNTEVQNTLKHHFENWKTKKSLGPSRLRSSSRSKDWSPRSRTESLRFDVPRSRRITEWTLVGAEDLEDYEAKRLSHQQPVTKESLLSVNQSQRKLESSVAAVHHHKFNNSDYLNPPKESLLTQRKESLVNQPLLELSEESPVEADSKINFPMNNGSSSVMQNPTEITVIVNQKGESVILPRNCSNLSLKA